MSDTKMSATFDAMPPSMIQRLPQYTVDAHSSSTLPTIYSILLFTSMMILQILLSKLPMLANSDTVHRYELRRKTQHVFTLTLLLYCYLYYVTTIPAVTLLASACIFMYVCHRARLVYPDVQRFMIRLFDGLIRPNERYMIPGSFYCLLGIMINAALYNTSTTAIALICVTYGDVAAAICGIYSNRYVKNKSMNKKSTEGSIGMFITCLVTTYIAYIYILRSSNVIQHTGLLLSDDNYHRKVSNATLMTLSVLASLTATVTERYVTFIDDNLSIQVTTAAILAIIQLFM